MATVQKPVKVLIFCALLCLGNFHAGALAIAKPAQPTYLLLAIDSSDLIEALKIRGRKRLNFSHDVNGIQFILTKVPAGRYRFSEVVTGLKAHKTDKDYEWGFTVQEGKVNYVGHIEVSQTVIGSFAAHTRMQWVNKSSFAIEHLLSHSPHLLQKDNLVYQGPGNDVFIGYYFDHIYAP